VTTSNISAINAATLRCLRFIMGKRSKSKTKASSKTSIKKKSLECRTFRKLSSTFATSLSVAEEEKQRQQRQQQQRLQSRRSVSTTPISVDKISSQNRPSLVQQKEETNSRIPNHEVSELNTNYQNLLERDYASTIHKTRSKKELRRCDLALKRKERKLRNMKRTMERPPSSQSQHSSSHSATTATALSCLKLFSFSPATFTVAPKTTTELLYETTFSLQGVALQEGQSPQATDMTFSNDPVTTLSSMSTAFQAQGNSKRDQNCSNPFHALQADIDDDNDNAVQRQSVAAPAMASFAFAPPSFAVPPPPTGTTEMGDDESIDPDL
jgi:hypothetical protein